MTGHKKMEENVEEEVKKKRGFALSFSLSLLRGHLEGENGQKKTREE